MYNTSDNYKSKVYNVKHLLNIYINDVDVGNKILEYKPSHQLFTNEEFSFGAVSCKGVELKLYKSVVPENINKVEIKSGINGEEIPIGIFNVDDISKDDDYTVTLKLLDNMIKFEFNYDGSTVVQANNGKATIMQVLQDICSKAGVELRFYFFFEYG